jgi:pilus assembly protein Flp/PilA
VEPREARSPWPASGVVKGEGQTFLGKGGERRMIKRIMDTLKEEEGATMVEYALMLALIAVVCIAVVTGLGKAANAKFQVANNSLQ